MALPPVRVGCINFTGNSKYNIIYIKGQIDGRIRLGPIWPYPSDKAALAPRRLQIRALMQNRFRPVFVEKMGGVGMSDDLRRCIVPFLWAPECNLFVPERVLEATHLTSLR